MSANTIKNNRISYIHGLVMLILMLGVGYFPFWRHYTFRYESIWCVLRAIIRLVFH